MLQFRKKISAFLLIVCNLILMFPGNSLAVEQCNITEHNNVTVVDEKHIENEHIFRLKINPLIMQI